MTSIISWDRYLAPVAALVVSLTVYSPSLEVLNAVVLDVPATETAVTWESTPIPVGGFLLALVRACRPGCCSD